MAHPLFKLPAGLMASFLALTGTALAQTSQAPSDAEIAAALKHTPRIEETRKGQEITEEIKQALFFAEDTLRIKKAAAEGNGTKYDKHDVYYNCKYADRHAGTAGFELYMLSIHPLQLFDKPATSPVETTTRIVVAMGQTAILQDLLETAQQETARACANTDSSNLSPHYAVSGKDMGTELNLMIRDQENKKRDPAAIISQVRRLLDMKK